MTSATYICCRALGSGAVSTYFYAMSLSWLGFEHQTFRLRCERSNSLRHDRGSAGRKDEIEHTLKRIAINVMIFPTVGNFKLQIQQYTCILTSETLSRCL